MASIVLFAVVAAAQVFVFAPRSGAAVTTVACDGQSDIADVQAAVDGAVAGDILRLSGTCDFSAALPHGGGVASIEAAAVLVRPGSPVTNLTIESTGSPAATVLGTGTQTAFAIAPGNDAVTIRGLRFVNLGRPVVVLGAANATVGAAGATPAPLGNRIVGHATMDSAVLGVADDEAMTVRYGAGGAVGTVTVTPSALTRLRALGNTITYSPPGPAGAQGVADVVGIDVRQAHGGVVDGVEISGNAVGQFTADLATFRHNAVRVEGLAPVPASTPPATDDYRVRNVTISGNNLGRFEELEAPVPGIDPGDTHAAGRVGVVVIRSATFEVSGNRVRSRVSMTGPMTEPGGGIVVSDSSFGRVVDNHTIVVVSDPTTPETADLGAVAVVDGIPALFGGSTTDQATTAIEVARNVATGDAQAVALRRGLVVSGADLVTAWDNEIGPTSGPAVSIGADVRGPTGAALTRRVTGAAVCANTLDRAFDPSAEVAFAPGSASSTGNAFPGGAAFAGNADCTPSLSASPSVVPAGGSLAVTGLAWARRPVDVRVQDEAGVILTRGVTASGGGSFSALFTSAELGDLDDGRLTLTATASDPGGATRASASVTVRKNFVADPPPAGTATISDGGDGFMNTEEMLAHAVTATWTAPSGSIDAAVVWWSDAAAGVPVECGPARVPPAGEVRLTRPCSDRLAQGQFRFHAFWESSDGEGSPEVSAASVKDTQVAPPVISSPAAGSTVRTSPVTVSGVAEPGATVSVTKRGLDGTYGVVATAGAMPSGEWSAALALPNGSHVVSAFIRDQAGNRSGSAPPLAFNVDTTPEPPPDTTPPAAPAITAPASGSVRKGTFTLAGTSEPGSVVNVYTGATLLTQTGADGAGNWAAGLSLPTGFWSLRANATDAAGNTGGPSNEIAVEVDATAAALAVTTPQDRVFGPLEPAVIEGTASDNRFLEYVAVQYAQLGAVMGVDFATCTPGCPTALAVAWRSERNLAPGVYDVTVFAVDGVENITVKTLRIIKLP